MLNQYFRGKFGGRLPFLRYIYSKLIAWFGGYAIERKIDWSRVQRLVFVCKGNINRSPFAEFYCKAGFQNARSVGLETENNLPASTEALRNASIVGVDLSLHKTCRISDFQFNSGDLVVAFEPSQSDFLGEKYCFSGAQRTLIGLWSESKAPFIQDPICREDAYFQACYSRISKGVDGILKNLH